MKVLWITGNFYPNIGGLQVYIDSLTSALTAKCDVALITESGQDHPTNEEISHFSVESIRKPATEEAFSLAQRRMKEIALSYAPDIVHFSNAGIAVYESAITSSIPTVVTVHGNDLTKPWQSVPHANVRKAIIDALNDAGHIIAISSHTKGLVKQSNVTTPVSVIRHGCDLDLFRPLQLNVVSAKRRIGVPVDCPILLTVARFSPRKGHLVLLKAIQKLDIRVHWIVVGTGHCFPEFFEEVQRCGMASRITIFRRVSNHNLCLLYNICDLFVLVPEEIMSPRGFDSEGFGLVFQEASACGKPVIGSDVSGCREAVADSESGILVPAGDFDALSLAINLLVTDRELAHDLGRRGALRMQAIGGWPRVAEETYSLYSELVADQRSLETSGEPC